MVPATGTGRPIPSSPTWQIRPVARHEPRCAQRRRPGRAARRPAVRCRNPAGQTAAGRASARGCWPACSTSGPGSASACTGWSAAHRGSGSPARDRLPLAGAVLFGGMVGPVLLMFGLSDMPASGASLLLNAEGRLHRAAGLVRVQGELRPAHRPGMAAIIAGAVVLAVPDQGLAPGSSLPRWRSSAPASPGGSTTTSPARSRSHDATWLAAVKGLVAGPVNLVLAFALGRPCRRCCNIAAAMVVGFSPMASAWCCSSSGCVTSAPPAPARTSRSPRSSARARAIAWATPSPCR